MKKILALALAVLMICSLTISAGASDKVLNLSDIIDFYQYYSKYDPYKELGDYLTNIGGIYSTWYDECPKCGGVALFRADDGLFKYTCTEVKCSASGTYDPIPDNKEETIKPDGYFTVKCAECGQPAYLYNKMVSGSNVYFEYMCGKKHETVVKNPETKPNWEHVQLKPVACSCCDRWAEFDSYFTYGDDLYATYYCTQKHKTIKLIDGNIYGWTQNDLYVRVSVYGSGNYSVQGGTSALYGEVKTITFTPNKGYELTKVTVNGREVEAVNNKITVTVYGNMAVRATFSKIKSNVTVTSTVNGFGSVKATVGSKAVDPSKITLSNGGKITYKLTPDYTNYKAVSIKVNGKSVNVPASGIFVLDNVTVNTKVEFTFGWKSPYADVADKYLEAVEYVTEAGVMGAVKAEKNKLYFNGTAKITLKEFAAVLAELSDTEDKLDTTDERIAWATKYGIVAEKADLTAVCKVQDAARMVDLYLAALEELNLIDFKKFDADKTAKANALEIGLVSAETYIGNRQLTRYDLASVAKLIANLEYTE